jgi:hypothetical protein
MMTLRMSHGPSCLRSTAARVFIVIVACLSAG